MLILTKKGTIFCIGLVWMILGILGCSATTEPRKPASKLDDPAHHALRGRDLIQENRWNAARREFRLALEINETYAPALAGQALVAAHDRTLAGKSDDEKAQLLEQSEDLLDRAFKHAQSPREEAQVQGMAIQIFTLLQTEDWLEEAEAHFEDAVEIYEDHPALSSFRAEPHFYLAKAYEAAAQYRPAATQYQKVLALNLGFTRQADAALEQIQKTMRAEPGSRLGDRIARAPSITRGDMAALLVEELRLPQLYGRDGTPDPQDTSFQPPTRQFVSQQKQEIPLATDIEDHPLKSSIDQVLQIGVRGLEPNPQHLFYPNKSITRAEYAIMLEDVLIQVTKDRALSRRFIGEASPWPDVRPDAYYYNAARALVSRNIMSVMDKTRGEFRPTLPIHGTEALLGIRTLKSELENYIRKPES